MSASEPRACGCPAGYAACLQRLFEAASARKCGRDPVFRVDIGNHFAAVAFLPQHKFLQLGADSEQRQPISAFLRRYDPTGIGRQIRQDELDAAAIDCQGQQAMFPRLRHNELTARRSGDTRREPKAVAY